MVMRSVRHQFSQSKNFSDCSKKIASMHAVMRGKSEAPLMIFIPNNSLSAQYTKHRKFSIEGHWRDQTPVFDLILSIKMQFPASKA